MRVLRDGTLAPDTEGGIGLGRRLARRLYPLTLAIVLLVSLGVPATDYLLESRELGETAASYAADLAARVQDVLVEGSTVSTARSEGYRKALREFLGGKRSEERRVGKECRL